jgi:uncharacterized protein YcaQ
MGQGHMAAITQHAARRIWLRAQRLDPLADFGMGSDAVRRTVAHLGYVQIDTINVIERCHHHILWSRLPGYRREDLRQAQSTDRTLFEYWTHALAYVAVEDLPFHLPAMRAHRGNPKGSLAGVSEAAIRAILKRIRDDGPLTIRDIDDDVLVEKDHAWASKKPSKRALQRAFFDGRLAIAARTGMLKTYDLMERHFGWERPPKPATERQIAAYRLDRALRSQGFVSLDSVCHLEPRRKPEIRQLIEARLRRKALVPVAIEGAGAVEHWAAPAVLEEVGHVDPARVHILSPFDPLIIQRKRLKAIFGYEHLFEAYVPKAQRVLGYFALPVLIGDEIVAALDLKTDRSGGRLLINGWHWVGQGEPALHKAAIETALHGFERFQLDSAAQGEATAGA